MKAIKYHTGKFPPSINDLDWKRLLPLIGPANAAVARYEGVLLGIPNAQVLLSPLTSQEAVLSSRIEGTQATLGEVLEFEAAEETAPDNKRDDILEILPEGNEACNGNDANSTFVTAFDSGYP